MNGETAGRKAINSLCHACWQPLRDFMVFRKSSETAGDDLEDCATRGARLANDGTFVIQDTNIPAVAHGNRALLLAGIHSRSRVPHCGRLVSVPSGRHDPFAELEAQNS